jgi:hypothetical protein
MQQPRSEGFLKLCDMLAGHRRRYPQALGRRYEAAGLHHFAEHPKAGHAIHVGLREKVRSGLQLISSSRIHVQSQQEQNSRSNERACLELRSSLTWAGSVESMHDFNSKGTSSNFRGIKVPRVSHFFSSLEATYDLLLEREPDVEDIQEQYPVLDNHGILREYTPPFSRAFYFDTGYPPVESPGA